MHSTGVITSLVTPFRSIPNDQGTLDTEIDDFHLTFQIRNQIKAGIPSIALAGWIGEGSTLSREERDDLVTIAVEAAAGRLKVFSHVGSCDTAKSVAYASDAAAAGADGLIVVTPFYNKPNAAGFRGHVEAIARASNLPLYLEFDVARTHVGTTAIEMASLAEIEGVAGVIDHSSNPLRVESMSACHKHVDFFTGHEPSSVASCIFGADGFLSAIANFAPAEIRAMQQACAIDRFDRARCLHERLLPLILLVEEEGVAALKYAMHLRYDMDASVRLPLVPLSRDARRRVERVVEEMRSENLQRSFDVAEDVR